MLIKLNGWLSREAVMLLVVVVVMIIMVAVVENSENGYGLFLSWFCVMNSGRGRGFHLLVFRCFFAAFFASRFSVVNYNANF